MAEVNRDQSADSSLVFRIGLHLGDLIVDGDDLYGDGVNVAARLEAEAPTGGIVISRTVHEAVSGRLKATFNDLGSLALKNIARPIHAFSVTWDDHRTGIGLAASAMVEIRRKAAVRLGSKGAIAGTSHHVRLAPESGDPSAPT
jgi:class 3 adenylate cyclase